MATPKKEARTILRKSRLWFWPFSHSKCMYVSFLQRRRSWSWVHSWPCCRRTSRIGTTDVVRRSRYQSIIFLKMYNNTITLNCCMVTIYLRQAFMKNTFGLPSSCFEFALSNISFIGTTSPSVHAKEVWFPWLLIKQMNLSIFLVSEKSFTLFKMSSFFFKLSKISTWYPWL